MTRLIKKAIKDKNPFYQRLVKNIDFTNNDSNLERFCSLQNNLTITIEIAKQQYFANIAKKLSDPNISSKTYWSILKCFLTGKKFPVFRLFFTITDLLPISEKRLNYLTLILLISAHCCGIAVYFLLIPNFLQTIPYQTSHLQTMIL